jgi:hypothetical protein
MTRHRYRTTETQIQPRTNDALPPVGAGLCSARPMRLVADCTHVPHADNRSRNTRNFANAPVQPRSGTR